LRVSHSWNIWTLKDLVSTEIYTVKDAISAITRNRVPAWIRGTGTPTVGASNLRINVASIPIRRLRLGAKQRTGCGKLVVEAQDTTKVTETRRGRNTVISTANVSAVVAQESVAEVAKFSVQWLRCGACLWTRDGIVRAGEEPIVPIVFAFASQIRFTTSFISRAAQLTVVTTF
jgi:hypothetical protein